MCRLRACGQPDPVRYNPAKAISVLRRYADRCGATEAGDAEVCRALEEAGAVKKMTIKYVYTLKAGETPDSYVEDPGTLKGPWGETVEEAMAALRDQAQIEVAEYWDRGEELWVILAETPQPKAITITNDFHGTSTEIMVAADGTISEAQAEAARKALCGLESCDGSGTLGECPVRLLVSPTKDGRLAVSSDW